MQIHIGMLSSGNLENRGDLENALIRGLREQGMSRAGISSSSAGTPAPGRIIHRDIKPANIFIASRDRVKVLDFGLAKKQAPTAHQVDVTTMAGTRQGVVMETAAYMAPEQARSEAVDHRADIWSFGLVLYEMVKGTRPPQAVRLRVEASPELERIISKCLETERELRYQHVADLRTDSSACNADPILRPSAAVRCPVGRERAGVSSLRPLWYWRFSWPATSLLHNGGAHRQGHDRARGVHQHDRRPGVRRYAPTRTRGAASAVAVPEPHLRRTHPTNAAIDEPACRCTTDPRRGAGRVRPDGRRGGPAGIDRGDCSQDVLGLRATSCATGDILTDEQAQASRKEDVLSTLSQMATRFRTGVGESLATVERYSTPLEATTASLEALQAYSAGFKAALAGANVRALALFQRAVAIDPDFASAHAAVGFRYSVIGESALARQSLLKAYQLRSRASDFSASTSKHCTTATSRGTWNGSGEPWKRGPRATLRDAIAHTLIAGLALSSTGQHELAIAETEKALALDPDQTPAYANRANNQVHLNRLDDALLTARRAAERKLKSASLLILVLRGLPEGDRRRTRTVGGRSQEESRHRRHDLAPGGAGAGPLRPVARRERDVRGRRRDRAASGSGRTGRLVRSGQSGVGSVLRECGRCQAERQQGAHARQGPRRGLRRGLRAGPLR